MTTSRIPAAAIKKLAASIHLGVATAAAPDFAAARS